jgi:hypothetical protein
MDENFQGFKSCACSRTERYGADAAAIAAEFINAIAAHRHLSRDCDPPLI